MFYLYLILGIVAALIVLILILASMKPDTFRIERSTTINAPAEKIFPHINDFRRWASWSPWEKLDPNLQRTFSGPESGPGSTYEWQGNKQVGKGKMEIKSTTPPNEMVIALTFIEPFAAENETRFVMKPSGSGTHFNWSMVGKNPFMMKLMGMMMNMDKMIGNDFEKGLASLKEVAEKS